MFRNYLTVALRNLIRQKLYSAITIAGLAVGLACVMFIVLFVRDELSYDKWLSGTKDLYQLEVTFLAPGRPPQGFATVPYLLPQVMHEQIPEVSAFSRFHQQSTTINVDGRQFFETMLVAEPNFFSVVRLPFVSGDPAQALSQPESVVLSESTARKYFGSANPVGRILSVAKAGCAPTDEACRDGTIPLTVTGVFKDIPHNSQLTAAVVIPNTSAADQMIQSDKQHWLTNNDYGYVTLGPGARPQTVLEKLTPILDQALAGPLRQVNINLRGSQVMSVTLTPFTAVHLASSRFSHNLTPPGSSATIEGVIAIGVLLYAGGLLQLHESGHGARHAPSARDRAAQDRRRAPPATHRAVPGRGSAHGRGSPGARSGDGGDPPAHFRWLSRAPHCIQLPE